MNLKFNSIFKNYFRKCRVRTWEHAPLQLRMFWANFLVLAVIHAKWRCWPRSKRIWPGYTICLLPLCVHHFHGRNIGKNAKFICLSIFVFFPQFSKTTSSHIRTDNNNNNFSCCQLPPFHSLDKKFCYCHRCPAGSQIEKWKVKILENNRKM